MWPQNQIIDNQTNNKIDELKHQLFVKDGKNFILLEKWEESHCRQKRHCKTKYINPWNHQTDFRRANVS